MRGASGAIGLIIYLAIMLLSGIVKMIAEQQAKQRQLQQGQEPSDPYTVTLEDILADGESKDALETSMSDLESEYLNRSTQDDWEEWDDGGWERLAPEQDLSMEGLQEGEQSLSLAQAVVMSEIVREPRSIRRWPSR